MCVVQAFGWYAPGLICYMALHVIAIHKQFSAFPIRSWLTTYEVTEPIIKLSNHFHFGVLGDL